MSKHKIGKPCLVVPVIAAVLVAGSTALAQSADDWDGDGLANATDTCPYEAASTTDADDICGPPTHMPTTVANLLLHFKASADSVFTGVDGRVQAWRAENTDVHAVVAQESPGNIRFDPVGLHGQPALMFSDTPDETQYLMTTLPGSASLTDATIFWLGYYATDSATYGRYAYAIGGHTADGSQFTHQSDDGGGGFVLQLYDGDDDYEGDRIDGYENEWSIWRTAYRSTGHDAWVTPFGSTSEVNLQVPDNGGYAVTPTPHPLYIGGWENDGYSFVGAMAELIVFEGELNASDTATILSYLEARRSTTLDNCPLDASADQTDTDGDGFGDVCDGCSSGADVDRDNLCDTCATGSDTDADGLCGSDDLCPLVPASGGAHSDADEDGIGDACDTVYQGIIFPRAALSFATRVVSLEYNDATDVGPLHNTGNPALGPPDHDQPSCNPDCDTYMSLGNTAIGETPSELVLGFDTFIVDVPGNDLYIFEIGPDVEATDVAISADGTTWYELGRVAGATRGVDIAGAGVPDNLNYSFVRLRDFPDGSTSPDPYGGPDIDAVGIIGAVAIPDSDDDGVFDNEDNCPDVPNDDQSDFDDDGLGDACDDDRDDDGVPNDSDADPDNPNVCGDQDDDSCDDCDVAAEETDLDEDGICDAGDDDRDNDGVPNESDSDPDDPDACGDNNGDTCEDCAPNLDDNDDDGLCDAGDDDDDNDGVADDEDPCPTDPADACVANNGTDNNGTDNNGTDNNGTGNNGTDNNGTDNNGTGNNGTDDDNGATDDESAPPSENNGCGGCGCSVQQGNPRGSLLWLLAVGALWCLVRSRGRNT